MKLAATCAQASRTWVSQTFSSGVTIPAGNPVGVDVTGDFTGAAPGSAVLEITLDLNISGGYNGSLAASFWACWSCSGVSENFSPTACSESIRNYLRRACCPLER